MSDIGSVILVGAGPGDAGLMTLRGKQALETADVVLYDRLVGSEILSMIPDAAVKVDVGKKSGHHSIPQHEINELLLHYARKGNRVVRLKGGDPYLFGRGAEELESLVEENIPFEVVPGVTSAIAVPAYAGIPVSHREFSSSVHIITAHRKNGAEPVLDYESLIKFGGTLIFLMGLGSIHAVTAGLISAGIDACTPAALIENGTRRNQRKLISTVAEITTESKKAEFCSPSVLIIGGVCGLADKLDWFSRLPLKGTNVVVTRPKTGGELSRGLRELGANVTDFPCIHTNPLPVPDSIFDNLTKYGWIVFTSPVGAGIFFDALKARYIDIRSLNRAKFAAIGEKTASAVTGRGIRVDYMPEIYNAHELADGLPFDDELQKHVLLFRAEDGTPELASALCARGFSVRDVSAYETIRGSSCSEEVREMFSNGEVHFVTFTSASTVQGFAGSLPGIDPDLVTAVCIGGETAAEARKLGFRVLISERAEIRSMIECIQKERIK